MPSKHVISMKIQACLPTFDTTDFDLGSFREGREWHGYYTALGGGNMVESDGYTARMGHGALTIKVRMRLSVCR